MGADFLAIHFTIPAKQNGVDTDKMLAAYDAATIDDFNFYQDIDDIIGASEELSELPSIEDMPDTEVHEHVKKYFRTVVTDFADAINQKPRDISRHRITEDIDIIITGGMSWGDAPTETFELFDCVTQLPDAVMAAANLNQPVPTPTKLDPVLDTAITATHAGDLEYSVYTLVGQVPGDDYADALVVEDDNGRVWNYTRDPEGKITSYEL